MGSLMAGWQSKSPRGVDEELKRSNSSLTKDEVDRFWKTRRALMAQHLEEANRDVALSPRGSIARKMAEEMEAQQKLAAEQGQAVSLPEVKLSNAWWTKSQWAFLNDPPVVNQKESKYVPQFEVASLGQLQTEKPHF